MNIGEASAVAGDVIYVKNDIDIDPIEAAGHKMDSPYWQCWIYDL